ncbi:heme/hemin ABC transporter substrate-binding protein [Curtobacterium sp. S6]|uniref:heme/hemin ABC transporter substrate-binding protein n=1 Tax=Curtobacterium sp. S6 TaxID=1479623 RepID=UPI0009E6C2C2|nr:ABC transporter substrate-binding protein [Curtobacterium sp. S6]
MNISCRRKISDHHAAHPWSIPTLVALLFTLVLVLAACGQGNGAPSQARPSSSASHASTPLEEQEKALVASAVSDPKAITGPATAASVPEVRPISDPQTPQLPVDLTDYQGTQVTVKDTSRLLALDLYGTLAETVIGLGQGEKLVGRVTSSTESSLAGLPLVTESGHDLNVEKILELRPTTVLMDTTNGPLEVTEQLRSAGITVVHFSPDRSIDQVVPQIEKVAQALGVPESGKRLAERVSHELDSVRQTIHSVVPKDPEKKVAMAFLYVRGNGGVFFILGQGSGADGLIQALDGIDVAGKEHVQDVKPATSEALVKLNPDLILAMTKGLESTGGLDGFLARPGVAETTAGSKKRVVDMADGQILSFGPNTPAVLLSLAQAIYAPAASGQTPDHAASASP